MKRNLIRILPLLLLIPALVSCDAGGEAGSVRPGVAAVKEVEGMVYVPPGKFIIGSKGSLDMEGRDGGEGIIGQDVGVDEFPRRVVENKKGFYIDRYEVTNAEYKRFIDFTNRRTPTNPKHDYDRYIWKRGTYPNGMEDHPVSLVDYEDAVAYCAWAGKRLPAEEEWEMACRGTDGRVWPWGNDFHPSKANVRELELRRSSPVGGFPDDKSPFGAFDMAGNVREWTSSWYLPYPGSTLKRETFGKLRSIRGGSWVHLSRPESRCAGRGYVWPDIRHRTVGFRCAKDAQ